MLEVNDYSNRRGALVPLMPKLHALLTENAEKDTLAAYAKPENIIFWKQKMGKAFLDIGNKFLLVTDGADIAGLMFYRIENGAAYLSQLQTAWRYRHNPAVLEMMLEKFVYNNEVKACAKVFAGENIRSPRNKELLAAVGFKETFPDGWEPLGNAAEAAGTLRARYIELIQE